MRQTIIACVIVALVAGATSATAANLITGSDVKNGSITGADLKNPTISAEDIKKGAVIKKKLSQAVQDALERTGATGPQGPAGPKGPAGPAGPAGPLVPTELGAATVFVDRGDGPTAFGAYSVPLASPGVTTSGHFRFSCTGAQAPCKVSLRAAVVSTSRTDTAAFYPRIVIHKEATGGEPKTFCEYADGPLRQIARVAKLPGPTAPITPSDLDVGSSLDCGASQPGPSPLGIVDEIWVPGGVSAGDPAFYDVWTTLAFGGAANGQTPGGS